MKDVREEVDEIVFNVSIIQIHPPQPNIIVEIEVRRQEDFIKRCKCGILFDCRKGTECDNCREKKMQKRAERRFAIIPFVDTHGLDLNCAAVPQEYVDRIVAMRKREEEEIMERIERREMMRFGNQSKMQMKPRLKIYRNDRIERYMRECDTGYDLI
jgi:hypothetical protein